MDFHLRLRPILELTGPKFRIIGVLKSSQPIRIVISELLVSIVFSHVFLLCLNSYAVSIIQKLTFTIQFKFVKTNAVYLSLSENIPSHTVQTPYTESVDLLLIGYM